MNLLVSGDQQLMHDWFIRVNTICEVTFCLVARGKCGYSFPPLKSAFKTADFTAVKSLSKITGACDCDRRAVRTSSSSLVLTDCSHVDLLLAWCKSDNFSKVDLCRQLLSQGALGKR